MNLEKLVKKMELDLNEIREWVEDGHTESWLGFTKSWFIEQCDFYEEMYKYIEFPQEKILTTDETDEDAYYAVWEFDSYIDLLIMALYHNCRELRSGFEAENNRRGEKSCRILITNKKMFEEKNQNTKLPFRPTLTQCDAIRIELQ